MARRKHTEDAVIMALFFAMGFLFRFLLRKWKERKFSRKFSGLSVNQQIAEIDVMDGRDFERFVANLYAKQGYKTQLTPGSGDQGIDVIAEKDGKRFGIQVKRYFGSVGNAAVQEVIAGKVFHKCDFGIVVTNSTYSPSAIKLAKSDGTINLIDRHRLKGLIFESINNCDLNSYPIIDDNASQNNGAHLIGFQLPADRSADLNYLPTPPTVLIDVKGTEETSTMQSQKPPLSDINLESAIEQHENYKTQIQENKQQIKLLKLREKTVNLLHKQRISQFDLAIYQKKYNNSEYTKLDIQMYEEICMFDDQHGIANFAPDLVNESIKDLKKARKDLEKHLAQENKEITKLDRYANQANAENLNESESSELPNTETVDDDSIPNISINTTHNNAYQSNLKSNTKRKQEAKRNIPIDDYFNDFIGLHDVRNEIKKMIAFLQTQKIRSEQGYVMKSPPSRHMVFTGNPGTGKTEMARLVAKIMYDKGLSEKDIFVEADRSDLIGEYLGHTAIKTKKLIESSFGGVLFIDEAYAIKTRDDDMYGDEAISTLLKMMEDHRDQVTVIVAGYEAEMGEFVESNPGLKSRFNRFIDFPDFDDEELFTILLKMIESNHYRIVRISEIKPIAISHFSELREKLKETFANARTVRNYFEKVIEQQALRLFDQTEADINILNATDFYQ